MVLVVTFEEVERDIMLCVAAVDGWQSYVYLACVFVDSVNSVAPYNQTNSGLFVFKVLLILTVLAG